MTTNPTEVPPGPPSPPSDGPQVSRDEVRDLARLRRTREDRKIAGVAGGIARHLDIDPVIPRVLLVVLVFFGGAGILLYAAAWLVVPVEGSDQATVRLDDRNRGVVLLIVGAVAALAVLGDSLGGYGLPWPVVVGGLVVLAVLLARGGEPRVHPLLRRGGSAEAGPTGSSATPGDRKDAYDGYDTYVRHERRRGPVLFWYAVATTVLGLGVLGLVDTAGVDVPASAYPAVALATSAALLLLGAFWGRAGGLVLLGLLATVATAGTTVAAEADIDQVDAAPTTAAAVADAYRLDIGEIQLDLTRVADPEGLDGRTVRVEIAAVGRIEVVVPDDVDVLVRSDIEAGDRQVFGEDLGDDVGARTTSVDGGPDAPTLTLDVSTGLGEIVVTRLGR